MVPAAFDEQAVGPAMGHDVVEHEVVVGKPRNPDSRPAAAAGPANDVVVDLASRAVSEVDTVSVPPDSISPMASIAVDRTP